jgi:hypothetical protein
VYPSAHSRASSPRFHPLSSIPQRQIHGHAGAGGAEACLSLALTGWSRTRTAYMLYASTLLTEKKTSSYNLQVHVCLVSPFCSLPCCSIDWRSPTCLIVACRSIRARPCNNQTWQSAACYITKETGRKQREKTVTVMLTYQAEGFITPNNYLQNIHTVQCMSSFLWTSWFTAGSDHNKAMAPFQIQESNVSKLTSGLGRLFFYQMVQEAIWVCSPECSDWQATLSCLIWFGWVRQPSSVE